MIKQALILSIFFSLSAAILACSSAKEPVSVSPPSLAEKPALPAQAKNTWETEWQTTLVEAKREGSVLVYQAGGAQVREALAGNFKNKYGIKVEFVTATGSEMTQKVLTERRAGLYMPDIYLGGASVVILGWKPAGAVDPLEPALILPEVTNPKNWENEALPFIDRDKKFLIFIFKGNTPIVINKNLVRRDEIKSFNDLLESRWKQKIIMLPPFQAGPANNWFGFVLQRMGEAYVRKLAQQEPVIMTNRRLHMEWLAQGKYPVALAASDEFVTEFMEIGAPVDRIIPVEGSFINAGPGGVSLMNKAPHPNAAKAFVNWLLTQEGQTVYTKAYPIPSARMDVPKDHIDAGDRIQPGVQYLNTQLEDYLIKGDERLKIAQEIFGPLLR